MSDYAYAGPPDIDRNRFIHLLALGSPAAPEGWAIYDALVRKGIRPLAFLAHWNHESRLGTNDGSIEARYQTKNPGAVRSIQNPEHGGVVIPTDKGPFVKYASYAAAAADWADRLLGEKYAGAGLHTVRQVIPKYAPSGDQGNQPTAYINSVLGFIERHRDQGATVPTMPPLTIDYVKEGAANRPGQKITPRYFTVHETANTNPGATAAMHRAYVHSGGGPQLTSYNYITDDREAFALIPIGESSHHAGTPEGNLSGVSTELCVNHPVGSEEWAATQDNALAIIAATYAKVPTLLPVSEGLVPHRHWRATQCPARLSGAVWDVFRARAIALVNGSQPSTDPLLEAEYRRVGSAVLGPKDYKARLVWEVDWTNFDDDVLVCSRGVVSTNWEQTERAQALFTSAAADYLSQQGKLTRY